MKIILILLFTLSLSFAQSIDTLLDTYAKESELSQKTKNESAGNLIVYTRDDLERMQVESLKDILKSLRLFAYTENRFKQPDILNQDPISYYSSGIRIYLNETELVTALTGSGFSLFGDMEMDFIDHVEIYQGFPSFDFGIEPATVVVRLYTKSAEHDEGGRVKANLSTNGAHKENAYYTNIQDGISYFIYANHTDDKRDSYNYDNEILKQDTQTNRFYGSVGIKNHSAHFHFMNINGDAFLGPMLSNVPKDTYKKSQYINLATNSQFQNDSLFLDLSYVQTNFEYSAEYDSGKYADIHGNIIPISSYAQLANETVFTASLKKKWNLESNALTVGAQYRYKKFDISDFYIDGTLNPNIQTYNKEMLYSIFLQDLITVNDNNLISLSVMNQEFVRNGDVNNKNTLQLRFGYIYSNEEWVSKTFISSQEFPTEPYALIQNKNLEEVAATSFLQEVSYQTSQTLSKIVLGYGRNDNMLLYSSSSGLQSSSIDAQLYNAILEFTYNFNKKDKLELQANYWHIESPESKDADPTEHISYMVRMLNTVSHFDIFNEFIVNTGYSNVDTGYNYSLGVKYNVNKDFHISFKGENIFDTALDADFYTLPPSPKIIVPAIERRFTFGMEYLF